MKKVASKPKLKFHSSGTGSYSSEKMWVASKNPAHLKKQLEYENARAKNREIFYIVDQD